MIIKKEVCKKRDKVNKIEKRISINFGRVNAARTVKERKKSENQVLAWVT